MKRTPLIVLVVTVLLAVLLLALIGKLALEHSNITSVTDRIEYYKLDVDLAKAVLVGFGAALLAILIPAVFSEARLSFQRLGESRTAYSEAKTGVDYLPVRLSTLDIKGATALVQRVHVNKHKAELFEELGLHLERRGIPQKPDQWADGLYAKLFVLRTILEAHAGEWDSLNPSARLALIREVIPPPRMLPLVEGSIIDGEIIGYALQFVQPDRPGPTGRLIRVRRFFLGRD